MTVAKLIIDILKKNNIEVIFGIPGSTNGPLVSAIGDANIKFVLVRNEQCAINAAIGYYKSTGKLGIATVISGPGILNAYPGIANAYLERSSILCIVGDISRENKVNSQFQNIDLKNLSSFVSKLYEIKEASETCEIMSELLTLLKINKGPIILSVPSDIQLKIIKKSTLKHYHKLKTNKNNIKPNNYNITYSLDNRLKNYNNSLIYVGEFDFEYKNQVINVIEKYNLPCIFSFGAVEMCKYINSKLNYGIYGEFEFNLKKFDIDQFDVIYILCNKLQIAFKKPKIKVYVKELLTSNMFNLKSDDYLIVNFKDLLKYRPPRNTYKPPKLYYNFIQPTHGISPYEFLKKLYTKISGQNCLICSEVGQHMVWALQVFIALHPNNKFIISDKLCFMGFGITAAIGAMMSNKYDSTVVICGDGSLQMVLAELSTIVEQNLDIKILLFNNNCLGMIRNLQTHKAKKKYFATSYLNHLDYSELCKACHMNFFSISKNHEIDDLLKHLFENHKPCLVELEIDNNLETYPDIRTYD